MLFEQRPHVKSTVNRGLCRAKQLFQALVPLEWTQATKKILETRLEEKHVKESGHETLLLLEPLCLFLRLVWSHRYSEMALQQTEALRLG